jgi:hypothetical protein
MMKNVYEDYTQYAKQYQPSNNSELYYFKIKIKMSIGNFIISERSAELSAHYISKHNVVRDRNFRT